MTPNLMKMATPVRPSLCKPEPDIPLSNETYMSNRTQLAQLRTLAMGRPSYAPKEKEAA
jgi:hypothetical protein